MLVVAIAACATSPRVDPQREEQAIRELDRQLEQAFAARDTTALLALYTRDAIFKVPNMPPAQGREAIRQMFAELFQAPDLSLALTPTRIEVARAGDLAYDVGTYRVSFTLPQGRVDDEGQYAVVWRKADGQWRAALDINSSSKPLPQPLERTVAVVFVDAEQPEMHASAGLRWTDLSVPGFAPGIQLAVVHGDPMGSSDYTIRLRFPAGYEFPPHWHPNSEHVTVLQGTFLLAMGERFDRAALKSYGPGDFVYAPAKMPHYGRVEGETIIQLHGIGPFAINLVSATP